MYEYTAEFLMCSYNGLSVIVSGYIPGLIFVGLANDATHHNQPGY